MPQVAAGQAADLGFPPPPPQAKPCCVSNWYLKGFIGITDYDVNDINSSVFKTSDFDILDTGFEGSGFEGLGLGYQANSWLRFDVTSEYRNRSTFHGLDCYEGPGFSGTNDYTATRGIGYANNWIGTTPT
jgi:opacity protein-like surface antigen